MGHIQPRCEATTETLGYMGISNNSEIRFSRDTSATGETILAIGVWRRDIRGKFQPSGKRMLLFPRQWGQFIDSVSDAVDILSRPPQAEPLYLSDASDDFARLPPR